MNNYVVLANFEHYQTGDIIQLNGRQAKYLLLAKLIMPVEIEHSDDQPDIVLFSN